MLLSRRLKIHCCAVHPLTPTSPRHGCGHGSGCVTSPLTLQNLHFYSLFVHVFQAESARCCQSTAPTPLASSPTRGEYCPDDPRNVDLLQNHLDCATRVFFFNICSQQISALWVFANCSFAVMCPGWCAVSRNVMYFVRGESYGDALMQLDRVVTAAGTRWHDGYLCHIPFNPPSPIRKHCFFP